MDTEGFINIQEGHGSVERRLELIVHLDTFGKCFDKNSSPIDYISITKAVSTTSTIGHTFYTELVELSVSTVLSRQHKCFNYFQRVMRHVSMSDIYLALCVSGYSDLFPLLVLRKHQYNISILSKVIVPCSKFAHARYQFVKSCVDNNCFHGDAKQKLNALRNRCVGRLQEGMPGEHQKCLEEMVTLDLHLIQLLGAADSNIRFEMLQQMKHVNTGGLDRTSLELTYHSKMAVTYAKVGCSNEAEGHIRQTLALCDTCVPCFATLMALNDVQYAYQELCYMHRTPELLERATSNAHLFYHLICCEDVTVINQWKRIILLFMAMTYLHISHEFEAGDINKVDANEIQRAEALIAEVLKVCQDIETRRQMVIYLCQGRLHERNNRTIAAAYVKQALQLSGDGCLRDTERINIEHYHISLCSSV